MIAAFTLADYDEAVALWSGQGGIVLSGADSRPQIARFLERNRGLSFVAREDGPAGGGRLIGTVLAGHDGRRGYVYHLAVHPSFRRRGLGRELARAALRALAEQGIEKVHLFLVHDNEAGRAFWAAEGWEERADIRVFSRLAADTPGPPRA